MALFDLYFHGNKVMENVPMCLAVTKRVELVKNNYPQCKTKGYLSFYKFFEIKFNNSSYIPKPKRK